jgi:hypothetical protein
MKKRGWTLNRWPVGSIEQLDAALIDLQVEPERRDDWRGRLHYRAIEFLLHTHAEKIAPRRKTMLDKLDKMKRWGPALHNLDDETWTALGNEMSNWGTGTLDQLSEMLLQMSKAATRLRDTIPDDRGGRTNALTERLGTAQGQLVVSIIQMIEAGIFSGDVPPEVEITGGPGGAVFKVAHAVYGYATGAEDAPGMESRVRSAAQCWKQLADADDHTDEKQALLDKLVTL